MSCRSTFVQWFPPVYLARLRDGPSRVKWLGSWVILETKGLWPPFLYPPWETREAKHDPTEDPQEGHEDRTIRFTQVDEASFAESSVYRVNLADSKNDPFQWWGGTTSERNGMRRERRKVEGKDDPRPTDNILHKGSPDPVYLHHHPPLSPLATNGRKNEAGERDDW